MGQGQSSRLQYAHGGSSGRHSSHCAWLHGDFQICVESKDLQQIDWATNINYTAFAAPWPVSGRDFLAVNRCDWDAPLGKPGAHFSYSATMDDKQLFPPNKKLVRGTLYYAALLIEPLPDSTPEAPKCKVTYTVSSDPNGSIPKAIVNAANISQPLCIAQVGKLIATNPALIAKMRKNKQIEVDRNHAMKEAYIATLNAAPPAPTPSPAADPASSSSAAPGAAASTSNETALTTDAPAVEEDPNFLPPNPYDDLLSYAKTQAISAIESEGATNGWVFHSRKDEVDIYLKTEPGSTINMCRGNGEINADVETIGMVFRDFAHRCEWDLMCAETREIQPLDWRSGVQYSLFKAPWPVSARDFLAVGRYETNTLGKKGNYFSWSASLPLSDTKLLPVPKGTVRGSLFWAGLYVEPCPGSTPQNPRCKVVYCLSSDPNGSIPKSLVNAANVGQPLCIAHVGKVIATNPDLLGRIRANQAKKAERGKLMKEEYLRNKAASGARAGGAAANSSASAGRPAASSGAVVPIPADPRSLSLAPVSALLRSAGPPFPHALQSGNQSGGAAPVVDAGQFVLFDRAVLSATQKNDLAAVESSARSTVPKWWSLLFQLALRLFLEFFFLRWIPDERSAEEDAKPAAGVEPAACGFLWVSLLDARQLVATFQSQQLALHQLALERGGESKIPPMKQVLLLHAELVGELPGQRQGCVAKVQMDLANPEGLTMDPPNFSFKVHTPHAKLVLTLYAPPLELVPAPVLTAMHQASLLEKAPVQAAATSQSLTGSLRNALNPGQLVGQSFDSFLHVFETVAKPNPSKEAQNQLETAMKQYASDPANAYQPLVRIGGASLSLSALSAPPSADGTATHARLGWVEFVDEEGGLGAPGVVSVAELLTQFGNEMTKASGGGERGFGAVLPLRKKQKVNKEFRFHPVLHTKPLRTHGVLLHSFYASSPAQALKSSFDLMTRTPPVAPSADPSYALLFHTLEGANHVLRVSTSHRASALHAYELMRVQSPSGVSMSPREGAIAPARSPTSRLANGQVLPVVVAKMLLSSEGHVLHARYLDQASKRALLQWAASQGGLLRGRSELVKPLIETETDAPPALERAVSSEVVSPATMLAMLDPFGSFSPLLLVSGWSNVLSAVGWLLKMVGGISWLLTWTDVYASFFAWAGLLLCIFYPSMIAAILPAVFLVALARQSAVQHFEAHLSRQNNHSAQEFDRARREAVEANLSVKPNNALS
jgi:hypothetical protein